MKSFVFPIKTKIPKGLIRKNIKFIFSKKKESNCSKKHRFDESQK